MNKNIAPVDLDKAYRLINHGPTVLVSSRHNSIDNVMAAAWACGLDYGPSKVTVVVDSQTKTRQLMESSGLFGLQVPTVAQKELTYYVGSVSLSDEADKVKNSGAKLFNFEGIDLPFVEGCAAWLACRIIPEPHIQNTYDLFIGEVIGAWSDTRVFKDGHWMYEKADPSMRSIHHVAGGNFYAIGESMKAKRD